MDSIFWEEVDIEVFGKNNETSWQSNIISGLGSSKRSNEDMIVAGEECTYTLFGCRRDESLRPGS